MHFRRQLQRFVILTLIFGKDFWSHYPFCFLDKLTSDVLMQLSRSPYLALQLLRRTPYPSQIRLLDAFNKAFLFGIYVFGVVSIHLIPFQEVLESSAGVYGLQVSKCLLQWHTFKHLVRYVSNRYACHSCNIVRLRHYVNDSSRSHPNRCQV